MVGGYGGPDACGSIVHPAVTVVAADGSTRSGPAMAGMVLAVDMAISADGKRVAFVSAGNATNTVPGDTQPALTQVFVSDTDSVTDDHVGCMPDGTHGPCASGFVKGGTSFDPMTGAPTQKVRNRPVRAISSRYAMAVAICCCGAP